MFLVEDGGNVIGNFPDDLKSISHGFFKDLVVKIV